MTNEERTWLDNASWHGGSFISTFANACFCADDSNFKLLQPVLAVLMTKYPIYSKLFDHLSKENKNKKEAKGQ